MTDPNRLLTLVSLGAAVMGAVLLATAPSRGGPSRRAAVLQEFLAGCSRRWKHRSGRSAADLRGDAGELMHQYAALLQSGRSPAQAWSDLSEHWRSRKSGHPWARVCGLAAAAEQAGLGAAVGLRRSLDSLAAGDAPGGGRGSLRPNRTGSFTDSTAVHQEVLQRLISVHAISQSTGAPLSGLCRKAAEALEDAAALDAAVETAVAGPRLTQVLLTSLPLGGLAMGALMGADPLKVLFGSAPGWACMVTGLGALLLGRGWSTRMIRAVAQRV